MDTNIDNLTGTESLDELEAMLEAIEREPDTELDDGTATEQTDVNPAPSAGEVAAGNEQANTEQDGEGATEPEKVILAKSGQHTIPYEVLEQSRNEVKVLREQLAASQQAQAERDKLQALMEKHGSTPTLTRTTSARKSWRNWRRTTRIWANPSRPLQASSKGWSSRQHRSRLPRHQSGSGRTAGGT